MAQKLGVRRLPRQTGIAGWDAILGPRTPFATLEGRRTFDVVVIGGGFAGLSAARRLLQLDPRASVAVIEAGEIGTGAAGRNSGFMIDLPHELTSEDYAGESSASDRSLIELNRHAIGFARQAVEEYAIPEGYFRHEGKVNGAVSEHAHAQNVAYAAHLASLNEGCEMLDAQAMQALTGSAHYRSGLYTPGTVMLQPAGYIRGLAGGLSQGCAIFENSPVCELVQQDRGWSVQTSRGRIDTGAVILANNGHLESFGFAKGRLMHIFLFASMTEELSPNALQRLGGATNWGVTPSDPMGTTMRRISAAQGGNRIITRTVARLRPGMAASTGDVAAAARVMRGKFDKRFPQLADVGMEYSWAGHLCLAYNGTSIAGRIDRDLYAACVCNGLGTTRSTLAGIAAAETVLGHQGEVTDYFAAQPMPQRLPPRPLAEIGANLFIRWKEWRAYNE